MVPCQKNHKISNGSQPNCSRSQAHKQCCVFCNLPGIRNATKHVLTKCAMWSEFHRTLRRDMVCTDLSDDAFVLRVLGCVYDSAGFLCVLEFAHLLTVKTGEFWANR